MPTFIKQLELENVPAALPVSSRSFHHQLKNHHTLTPEFMYLKSNW
jgi:hypothetical protein